MPQPQENHEVDPNISRSGQSKTSGTAWSTSGVRPAIWVVITSTSDHDSCGP